MEDDLMATLAGSDFPFLFSKWRIENLMGLATGFYVTTTRKPQKKNDLLCRQINQKCSRLTEPFVLFKLRPLYVELRFNWILSFV